MIRRLLRRAIDRGAHNSTVAGLEARLAGAHLRIGGLRGELEQLEGQVREALEGITTATALRIRADNKAHRALERVADLEAYGERQRNKRLELEETLEEHVGALARCRVNCDEAVGEYLEDYERISREFGVAHGRIAELEQRLGGLLFPLRVSLDGVDLYELDVDAMAGGAHPSDRGDGLPSSLTLRQVFADDRPDVLESYLRAPGESLRLHWHADLEAVDSALERVGVPSGPAPLRSLDRSAADGEPRPSLSWRLSWLEGLVALLRSDSQQQHPEVSHERTDR